MVALALPATASSAMDYQEMLAQASQNDARVKVLSGVLANTQLAIEKAGLAPGFRMKLSTGEMRFGYSFFPEAGDPPWQLSVDPTVSMILGSTTETEISVQLPLALGFGGGVELAALPRARIRQPLDRLRGESKLTEAQESENRYAAEKARIDVLNRLCELERSLVRQLAVLVELEKVGRELERKLSEAREQLAQARALQSFAEGSVQQRQAEFAAAKLERELELHRKRETSAWSALESIVGGTVDSLPDVLPSPALQLPSGDFADRNPEVYLAGLSVQVESLLLEEAREPATPRFFLGGAVDSRYSEAKDRTYSTVGGTLEGVYEDFSFSAGVGGIVETGSLFVSAGFSWSLQDRRIEELDRREKENSLEISRWNLEATRAACSAAREALALEIGDLALRISSLDEERSLVDLRLAETSRWLEQGFATQKDLDALRWEREKLDYSAKALQLDRLLAQSRLEQLVALEAAP